MGLYLLDVLREPRRPAKSRLVDLARERVDLAGTDDLVTRAREREIETADPAEPRDDTHQTLSAQLACTSPALSRPS
jgi:hypothetical protein